MLQDLSTASAHVPSPVLLTLFWASAAACVVAQYFIVRAVVRAVPSETGSPDVPSPNKLMEIAWAILPALLMVAVFVGAWRHMHVASRVDLTPITYRSAPSAPAVRS
jgi:heme/copper-type cytochrome/quinol oxidase subunit 2